MIERTGGEIGEVNNWGRRKLAYEIDHRADGFYYVMQFTVGERDALAQSSSASCVSRTTSCWHIIVKLPPTMRRTGRSPMGDGRGLGLI